MTRISISILLIFAAFLGIASSARADVDVWAPFVRVQVNGGGVHVRAPFVNIFVPRTRPVLVVPPQAVPAEPVLPPPQVVPGENATPPNPEANNAPASFPTMEQFVRNFEPQEGKYEVTMLNPVSGQPTAVQFALPAGNPRIFVYQRQIEFDYGRGKSVRIAFTPQGVAVTP